MKPIKTETTNHRFGAPADWNEERDGPCETLPVTMAHGCLFSYWMPSEEELAQLNAGYPVRLGIHGVTHPVVSIDTQT